MRGWLGLHSSSGNLRFYGLKGRYVHGWVGDMFIIGWVNMLNVGWFDVYVVGSFGFFAAK